MYIVQLQHSILYLINRIIHNQICKQQATMPLCENRYSYVKYLNITCESVMHGNGFSKIINIIFTLIGIVCKQPYICMTHEKLMTKITEPPYIASTTTWFMP